MTKPEARIKTKNTIVRFHPRDTDSKDALAAYQIACRSVDTLFETLTSKQIEELAFLLDNLADSVCWRNG